MAHIYETAIKLSLVETGVLSGISAIVAQLARGTGEVAKFEKALVGLKGAAWGVGGIFAGWEAIKGIKHLADHAKELSHELVQIKKLGSMTDQEFAQFKGWAMGMPGRVPGTTTVDAAKTFGAIQSMFGKDQAMSMGDTIARFGQVLGNQKGNWDNTTEAILKMIRAGDLMGKFVDSVTHKVDVGKLQRFLDLGTRVINATHGMISAETWFGMAQQGGPALSNMTDEGLLSMAMVAQGMGGQRAGTALFSGFSQLVGGVMTQWKAQLFKDMGFVGDFTVNKGGHLSWAKGALDTNFTRAFQKDPMEAVKMLQEGLVKQGYDTIEKQVPMLYKLFQRQTTIREWHDLLRNMPQMLQERERIKHGMGAGGSANIANLEDYEQVMHNAAAAWNDMTAKVGLPITVAAIPVMHKITEVFIQLGTLAIAHPDVIANLATGITVLGAALMGGGGVAILAALGPAGWLAAGIIAAGAAMALYKNPIMTWLENIRATNWNEEISKALEPAIVALKAWFKNLGTAIMDSLSGMWNDMKRALHLISFGGGGFGGGGGLTNASWGGGGAGAIGTGSGSDVKAIIDQAAARHGVSPSVMYGIIAGESGHTNRYDSNRRGESSWSMFQLNRAGGLGNKFEHDTGLSVMNPSNIPAIADWTADYIAKYHNLSPWRGYHGPRNWNPNWGSMGYSPHHKSGGETHVHNNIYLDGKVIAKSTVKHMVQSAKYASSVGKTDSYGQFIGPSGEWFG
jgi:hypothetical protein